MPFRASHVGDVLAPQALDFGEPLLRWTAQPVLKSGILGFFLFERRESDDPVHLPPIYHLPEILDQHQVRLALVDPRVQNILPVRRDRIRRIACHIAVLHPVYDLRLLRRELV